jgi:dCMP deaminase
MTKWDKRFMDRCKTLASWSKDDIGVGAVIVDQTNKVISEGYNGVPRGCPEFLKKFSDAKLHAEQNAILFARRELSGQMIYVWPYFPCGKCASMIVQVGITEVVVPEDCFGNDKWIASWDIARILFDAAGIKVRKLCV